MITSFFDKLAFSRGQREQSDIETLMVMLPGCISIIKTDIETDKAGIDYIAALRKGATILIDAKAREPGAAKWWRNGPELALELWSVKPGGKYNTPKTRARTGWTLCEQKQTDLILFTFDPLDTNDVFLFSFQLLRIAFRQNASHWRQVYKIGIQDSGSWESECVFVPVNVVASEVNKISRGKLVSNPLVKINPNRIDGGIDDLPLFRVA